MKHLVLVCTACLIVSSASAQTQTSPNLRHPLNVVNSAVSQKGLFTVIEDPLSGCRYFITRLPGSIGLADSAGIPTIRYRADGKPDCENVK